ncbi:MAG: SDR family oxidoreductase [Saccharofermentanales bacterium]
MKNHNGVDLTGKIIVVTGGGGVICSGFANVLANCGASIAVLDLKYEAAAKVANEITADGGSAIAIEADVLDKVSLENAEAMVLDAFGKCDILINGAGGNHPKGITSKEHFEKGDIENPDVVSFFDLDYEGIKFVFDLNFLGTFLPIQVFSRNMIGRTGCNIINLSSMAAFKPLTKVLAYSASKAAISNLTAWLAVHFADEGIRVNAIAPGFFATAQNHSLLYDKDGNLTERSGKIIGHTPMGRFGTVDNLTGTLLWLVDEKSSGFITGVVIPIDGGFSAYAGV